MSLYFSFWRDYYIDYLLKRFVFLFYFFPGEIERRGGEEGGGGGEGKVFI